MRFTNYDAVISHKYTHTHTHTHTHTNTYTQHRVHTKRVTASEVQKDTYRHAEEPPTVTTKAHSQTHRYVLTQRHGHAEGQKNTGAGTDPERQTQRQTGTHKLIGRRTVISNTETSMESKGNRHILTQAHLRTSRELINTGKMRRAIHLYVCKAFVNKLLAAIVTGTVTRGLLLSDVGRKHLEQRTSRKLRHHFRP